VTALYGFGKAFVGADAGLILVPTVDIGVHSSWGAPAIHLQLGVKL
jgi:hypothetical protein